MADVTYDQVAKLADQLPAPDQLKLIDHLRAKREQPETDSSAERINADDSSALVIPTREELIQELRVLQAAGAFNNADSLYGQYANPDLTHLSEADFHAELHAVATEWEQELDEFDTDHD